MAAESTTYQCPNCNGVLRFNGDIGKLKCDFCGSEFTADEVERIYAERQAKADQHAAADERKRGARAEQAAQSAETSASAAAPADDTAAAGKPASAAEASVSEAAKVRAEQAIANAKADPIREYLRRSKWDSAETGDLRAFNCSACGAQLLVDQVTAVTSCPYCGNNAVVPGQLADVLKPDYVIPFKFDRAAAVAALKDYYKGKRFLPNDFTAHNHVEEIQGVYVPFWLYSGTGEGDVTFNGRNVRTWADSENTYVETDHYLLHRVGAMQFARVPVDGSTRMPDAHMDAIEPFDYSEMVPFSIGYLPGYLTDRYDLDVEDCDERARSRVESTCIDQIRTTAGGYMEVDVAQSSATVNWTNIAYALLPVWMLHTKWNGDDYLFAMNGQTGKLIGDLPVDHGKVARRFLMIFVPLAIVVAIAVFFTMGF